MIFTLFWFFLTFSWISLSLGHDHPVPRYNHGPWDFLLKKKANRAYPTICSTKTKNLIKLFKYSFYLWKYFISFAKMPCLRNTVRKYFLCIFLFHLESTSKIHEDSLLSYLCKLKCPFQIFFCITNWGFTCIINTITSCKYTFVQSN